MAFLRNDQIFVIAVGGGEARQLTQFGVGVANLSWSPAGNALSFTANVHLDDQSFQEAAERKKKEEK